MASQLNHWNVFSFHLLLKGSQISPRYIHVVGCYAKCTLCEGCAWNNSYNGQEEALLCIVKYLKEDKKLVFQMRNKVRMFNNNVNH